MFIFANILAIIIAFALRMNCGSLDGLCLGIPVIGEFFHLCHGD